MIPAPAGSKALFRAPYTYDGMSAEIPVVAFSDGGEALVCNDQGQLVPVSLFHRKGWTFELVVITDPVVAIERGIAPVRIDTATGEDIAYGWAYRASGDTSPILDDKGTPWVYGDGWSSIPQAGAA